MWKGRGVEPGDIASLKKARKCYGHPPTRVGSSFDEQVSILSGMDGLPRASQETP